tara:strand:- start:46 stop:648 length:603 start_codon:yes stop_codon:yes gene_type:complete
MILRKYLIKFSFIFIILLSFVGNSLSNEPSKFIQEVVNEASNVLITSSSREEKMSKLISIAEKSVDIKGIGLYSLGSYRKKLSNEQKKEYNDLFRKYFLKSFSSRLSEYSDPKINVISQNKLSENYTIVYSILVGTDKTPEIKIEWRVYTKNPDEPLIRDLIIEGLSLARTQKEEFNSIIQSNDGEINALFSNLKEFING